MSAFHDAIGPLLQNEGGHFVAEDNGRGASKWGVTLATYREFYPQATAEDIRQLGPEQASAFYRRAFWERYKIGLLEHQTVANKVFDLAVNCGPATAIKMLQRAVGTPADGALGPKTAAAANKRAPELVLAGIRTAGAQYYAQLVDRRPDLKGNLKGWLARLAK